MDIDDIERDHQNLKANKVIIVREPSKELYGIVLAFSDLDGAPWDLVGQKK